jgi:DNA invertase Pin-like site-specific DNA recombinase
VHFVVVFNLTRFARDKYDHFALRSHPQALGISLRSATEPIDDTSTGKLMEGVLAAFAQFDNDVSSEWTRAGMRAPILRRIFEDYPTGQSRSSSVGGTRRLAEQPREAPHRMEDLLEQGSSEMALRERAARTGLQVVLESDGAPFVRELHPTHRLAKACHRTCADNVPHCARPISHSDPRSRQCSNATGC